MNVDDNSVEINDNSTNMDESSVSKDDNGVNKDDNYMKYHHKFSSHSTTTHFYFHIFNIFLLSARYVSLPQESETVAAAGAKSGFRPSPNRPKRPKRTDVGTVCFNHYKERS